MVPVSVLPVKKSVLPVRFEADGAFIKDLIKVAGLC